MVILIIVRLGSKANIDCEMLKGCHLIFSYLPDFNYSPVLVLSMCSLVIKAHVKCIIKLSPIPWQASCKAIVLMSLMCVGIIYIIVIILGTEGEALTS